MISSGEGGPSPARFSGVEEWRDLTVGLCEHYVRLQVNDPIADVNYLVIALGLTDVVLMIAVPQRFAPWRPPASSPSPTTRPGRLRATEPRWTSAW